MLRSSICIGSRCNAIQSIICKELTEIGENILYQRLRNHHEDEEVVDIKVVDNPKFGQMGIAEEEDVNVYYGTPLVSEEELNPRKRKVALEEGQARHVAPWNQEVGNPLYSSSLHFLITVLCNYHHYRQKRRYGF